MTKKRAKELKEDVSAKIKEQLKKDYTHIFILLGKNYRFASGVEELSDPRLIFFPGTIGFKLQALKKIIIEINEKGKIQ